MAILVKFSVLIFVILTKTVWLKCTFDPPLLKLLNFLSPYFKNQLFGPPIYKVNKIFNPPLILMMWHLN
jgi:hypothetical protein